MLNDCNFAMTNSRQTWQSFCLQVHFFADLKDKQDVPAAVDECIFSLENSTTQISRPGRPVSMFDNHVYYTGYRVICDSPYIGEMAFHDAQSVWAGLGWRGTPYRPKIPVSRVGESPLFQGL